MEVQIDTSAARQKVTAQMFAAKFKSKKEVFVFLTVNCKAYIAPHDCVTIYFLKKLVDGTRKCKWLKNP